MTDAVRPISSYEELVHEPTSADDTLSGQLSAATILSDATLH